MTTPGKGIIQSDTAALKNRLVRSSESELAAALAPVGDAEVEEVIAELLFLKTVRSRRLARVVGRLARERDEVRQQLENAFVAGFGISGEGYNGEYPFENEPRGEMRKKIKPNFDAWLKATTTALKSKGSA